MASYPRSAAFDPETHWHPSHVGDLRTDKWSEQLTRAQADMVSYATRGYRKAFHYKANPPVCPGTEMEFRAGGVAPLYMDEGFCPPEAWGAWAVMPTAGLRFSLSNPVKRSLRLSFLCMPGPSLQREDLNASVRLLVNGVLMTEIFSSSDIPPRLLLSLAIEGGTVVGQSDIDIRFECQGMLSPVELGLNADDRKLGIGLISLRIEFDSAEDPTG